jgi:hypothetical protein
MSSHYRKSTDVEQSDVPVDQLHTHTDALPVKPLLKQETINVTHDWPKTAKPLKTTFTDYLSDVIVDVALLTLSVGFLAFALSVRHYDHASTVEHSQAKRVLLALSKVGPSVFPILFAAVVGRTTHAILLWRLERGERVGTLDILAGSTSLTSTVNSQLQLRIISIFGITLATIWALSPIGGQASIRQLSFSNGTHEEPVNLSYMVPSGTGNIYGSTSRTESFAVANSIFLAALYSPAATRSGTLDLWGNIKVPLIEVYENKSRPTTDGWFNAMDSQPMYASLIGTPVAGYTQATNVTYAFNIDTSYLYLDCPIVNSMDLVPASAYGSPSDGPGSWFYGDGATIWLNYNASCGGMLSTNESGPLAGIGTYCTSPPGTYSNNNSYNTLPNFANVTPRNFTYYGQGLTTQSFCTITTTYVEMEIACPSVSPCEAKRLRRSRLSHPPAAYTILDELGGYGYPAPGGDWGFLLGGLLTVFPLGQSGQGTVLQEYLLDPDTATNPLSHSSAPFSKDLWAIRQGQLMNAYMTSLAGTSSIIAGKAADSQTFANVTTGTKTTGFEVIVCHQGWTVALSIASFVLIIACVLHLIIRLLLNRTPDLMLNISSLATRDNPYVDIDDGGTALDASKRARLLQNLKVRFGDVQAEDDIGRLAIASLGTAKAHHVGKVRKRRLYR